MTRSDAGSTVEQGGKWVAGGISASANQIDDYTIEVTLKNRDQYNHSQKWTVSKDGNSLTIEQTWPDERHSVGTFRRQ